MPLAPSLDMLIAAVIFSSVLSSSSSSYSPEDAAKFICAQHWTESGLYASKGLSEHYDGYFCLYSCSATPEGIFCSGAGVQPSGAVVGEFLGVFSESRTGG